MKHASLVVGSKMELVTLRKHKWSNLVKLVQTSQSFAFGEFGKWLIWQMANLANSQFGKWLIWQLANLTKMLNLLAI